MLPTYVSFINKAILAQVAHLFCNCFHSGGKAHGQFCYKITNFLLTMGLSYIPKEWLTPPSSGWCR
jgi:hypothetical protein